jgi:cytochrome b
MKNDKQTKTVDYRKGYNKSVFLTGKIDIPTRAIHLGIMLLGLAAYITGDGADDYNKLEHSDYILHKWLGIGLATFVLLRIIYGFVGASSARFKNWIPYTKERLHLAYEGLRCVFLFRKPGRDAHQGIAGLINATGLAIFFWMATTGTLMFFFLEPGKRSSGFIHFIKEIHEVGEGLIPTYLIIHIGTMIIHAIYGRDIWRKMLFIKRRASC